MIIVLVSRDMRGYDGPLISCIGQKLPYSRCSLKSNSSSSAVHYFLSVAHSFIFVNFYKFTTEITNLNIILKAKGIFHKRILPYNFKIIL